MKSPHAAKTFPESNTIGTIASSCSERRVNMAIGGIQPRNGRVQPTENSRAARVVRSGSQQFLRSPSFLGEGLLRDRRYQYLRRPRFAARMRDLIRYWTR